MVQPPRLQTQLYPPISMGQIRGMRRTRRIPTKRRKKTNLKAETKRGERLTMPYRTAKQVKKQPSIYQTAGDFLSIHQQSLINRARDQAQVQRLETAEEKRQKTELLQIQKQRLSLEDRRDRERNRTERVKEENRRVEERIRLDQQKIRSDEEIRVNNARLYQEAERARRQALQDQANNELKLIEQQKQIQINRDNIQAQQRLAEQSYAFQTNLARINGEAFAEYQRQVNARLEGGERRLGEIEQAGRAIVDELQRQRQPVQRGGVINLPDAGTTIPSLRPDVSSSSSETGTDLSEPQQEQQQRFGPPPNYFQTEPELSAEEQQEIRDKVYKGVVDAIGENEQQLLNPNAEPNRRGSSPRRQFLESGLDLPHSEVSPIIRPQPTPPPPTPQTPPITQTQSEVDRQSRRRQFLDESIEEDTPPVLTTTQPQPEPTPEPEPLPIPTGDEARQFIGNLPPPTPQFKLSQIQVSPSSPIIQVATDIPDRLPPTPALDSLRAEAQTLKTMISKPPTDVEAIDEEPSLTGSAFEVLKVNPKPTPPTPTPLQRTISPLQLADAEEQTERQSRIEEAEAVAQGGGLGTAISEGLATGGQLVAEGVGAGLRGAGNLAVGVVKGAGEAVLEQLPTPQQVGETIGSVAVQGAQALGNVAVEGAQALGERAIEALTDEGLGREGELEGQPEPVQVSITPAGLGDEPDIPAFVPDRPEELEPEPEPLAEPPVQQELTPAEQEARLRGRLDTFDELSNLGQGKSDRRRFDGNKVHYRLVVLEDLDNTADRKKYGMGQAIEKDPRGTGGVPIMKKGDQFRLKHSGFTKGATNANQRYFQFYRRSDGEGSGTDKTFNLNLFDRSKGNKIRQAIKDGKIKIVYDNFITEEEAEREARALGKR